ncbi:ribonuclease III [candidate division GN15 bacterium]|nr:ribonuclease III [candidate division GN15 bacterium]
MSIWSRLKELLGLFGDDFGHAELESAQQLLGYHFREPGLLVLALTHRSYSHSLNKDLPSNERLEFLGDSVLGLIIADRLYEDHPDMMEGQLTKTKAKLVNEGTLAEIGIEVGLNKYLLLSEDEDRAGGRDRHSIMADAFEAIIGAAYIDGGLDPARDIVLRLIYTRKETIVSDRTHRNFKGALLELAQARGEGMPRYEVVSESGPDHEKVFSVVVTVDGERVGSGAGFSKKEAEQRAASAALDFLRLQD